MQGHAKVHESSRRLDSGDLGEGGFRVVVVIGKDRDGKRTEIFRGGHVADVRQGVVERGFDKRVCSSAANLALVAPNASLCTSPVILLYDLDPTSVIATLNAILPHRVDKLRGTNDDYVLTSLFICSLIFSYFRTIPGLCSSPDIPLR